ncbi:MAG: hypothetical protein KDA25_04820, partial [Phycisphaerales bacterium]|nr:hypothetical protein [Phycisphaerales bacterium]
TLCNDETVVVPGHGVTGDKALIEAQITLFETIRAAVKDAVAAGKTADEIKAMPFPRFAAYGNERRDTTIAVILDELVGWKNTP